MYRYLAVKERPYMDGIGEYTSFGIRVVQGSAPKESSVLYVPDVSVDFAFIEKLTGLCAEHQPDPIHLLDVIEDLL